VSTAQKGEEALKEPLTLLYKVHPGADASRLWTVAATRLGKTPMICNPWIRGFGLHVADANVNRSQSAQDNCVANSGTPIGQGTPPEW